MARSGCGSAAIFASTTLSPSAWGVRRPPGASVFNSWIRSLIATRSSSVNPVGSFPVPVELFCVPFFVGFIVLSFATSVSTPRCLRIQRSIPASCNATLTGDSSTTLRDRIHLESRQLAPGTINLRLGAVRRLAVDAPDPDRLKGKRDRALLTVLLACGLRRHAAAELKVSHLQ